MKPPGPRLASLPACAAPARTWRQAAIAASIIALMGSSVAAAQPAEPAPSSEPTSPPPNDPPQPPPNYPPPPPNYPRQPPPNYPPPPPQGSPPGYGYYQPMYAPPRALYRPFVLGLGLGLGTLHFVDFLGDRASEPGLSYTLRVGFGVTRRWLILLGADGTGVNHRERGVWQTAYTVGAQLFLLERLYLRAGVGLAEGTSQGDTSDLTGPALMGGAGFELAQGYSTSVALEASIAGARYRHESWLNAGFNFVLSFF